MANNKTPVQAFEPRTLRLLQEWAEAINHQEDLFLNDVWLSSRGITSDDLARLTNIIGSIVASFTMASASEQMATIVGSLKRKEETQ